MPRLDNRSTSIRLVPVPAPVPAHAPTTAPAPDSGLLRPRLLHALDPLPGVRLTLLVAPAGAGKTTLLRHWSAAQSVPVHWCGSPAARPAAVLADVSAALGGRDDGRPLTVVIDGAEVLRDRAAVSRLEDLLTEAPPQAHVVLAARELPPLNLARQELSVRVVNADLLRFRVEETAALFRDVYGVPLSGEDIAHLTRRTHGWAAALHLFNAALSGQSPAQWSAAVRVLGPRVAHVRSYVEHHVLADLPAEQRAFLRLTSPLESLTGRRCDELLGCTGSDRMLLDVERRLSLVGTPDAGLTYVVHPVLRDHLLAELRDVEGESASAAALRTASALHARDGEPDAAARALVAAADWDALRALATARRDDLLQRDPGWLEDVPDRVVATSPDLRLLRAAALLRDGRLAGAAADADAARSAADPDLLPYAEELLLVAETWLGADVRAGHRWELRLHRALVRPVDLLDRQTHATSAEDELVRAVARAVSGDLGGARRDLSRCAPQLAEPGARVFASLLDALLEGAPFTRASEVVATAEAAGFTGLARAGRLLVLAGATGPGSGHNALGDAILDADRAGDAWSAVLACGLRATSLLRSRKPDVAGMEELAVRLRGLRAPALEAWARSALALGVAGLGHPEAASEAESAVAFAFNSQVPGALAVAHAALAVARPEQSAELFALARIEAGTAGFDLRPWEWVATAQAVEAVDAVPPVSVTCFGGFSIHVDGREPSLKRVRPRARELLRILALHAGQPVHRDVLLEALWPDLDPEAGAHNLHVAVSSLRTTLEPGVSRGASRLLVRQGDRYQLVLPAGSRCDLLDFDEAILTAAAARVAGDLPRAAAALERATTIYRGEVLPDAGPAEWVVAVRDRYRIRAAEAAGRLAEIRFEAGEHRPAAEAAQRSIEIDPWRDASWRVLEASYDAAGDVAAAQRTRVAYAEMLGELGLDS